MAFDNDATIGCVDDGIVELFLRFADICPTRSDTGFAGFEIGTGFVESGF